VAERGLNEIRRFVVDVTTSGVGKGRGINACAKPVRQVGDVRKRSFARPSRPSDLQSTRHGTSCTPARLDVRIRNHMNDQPQQRNDRLARARGLFKQSQMPF
jgi:hypothetical protein